MLPDVLETYVAQHIEASPDEVIRFSWHGGEPTVLGVDFFRQATALQRKHRPSGKTIANGLQTNGTLLDEDWGRFLVEENFAVGLSLDGPREFHDLFRVARDERPTYEEAMRGYKILRRHGVNCDILSVISAANVGHPLEVYRFFKQIGAPDVSFLPLVEPRAGVRGDVSPRSVTSEAWGDFLSAVFDEWVGADIGRIKIQIFEEASRTAFGQEHSLCLFRPTCGDIPVVEHNGDFYSCDHYVDAEHRLGNIRETHLADLLESRAQREFGQAKLKNLPPVCRDCEVLDMCHGECPKNRFSMRDDGEPGLNFLCAGYKRFFNHCTPFVTEVAAEWRRQNSAMRMLGTTPTARPSGPGSRQPGRNDPCPCGSGLKFKKCCLIK